MLVYLAQFQRFVISVKNEFGNGVNPVFDGSNLRNHGVLPLDSEPQINAD